mmetsp:Transcript_4240/g.10067  ORF Transcript_4240/g.10067 Transcript_4240/m.10067 type:complete len:509 (-) Transcript_4240:86-1612(-)
MLQHPTYLFSKAFDSIQIYYKDSMIMVNSSNRRGGIEDNREESNLRPSWPPRGKTYLTIGQDFFSIQEYLLSQYNASLHRPDGHHIVGEVGDSFRPASSILPLTNFHPACTMTYTDIHELKGLDQPADYGSGIEYAKGLAEAFPESGLQIGLWLKGSQGCRDIVSGALDDNIYRLFEFIQSELPESLPKVFLRVGYEFDNPWFGFSDDPEVYQEAFRALVRACETKMTPNLCHQKVVFVWHSWAAPRKFDVSLDQFYPGDSYVDWIGVSIFQQVYPWANDGDDQGGNFAGGNMHQVREVLEFAKAREKPIMIAESTPFGGMNITQSSTAKKYIADDTETDDIWSLWFQKTIDLIDEYDISMWSYINCDWGSQPMWRDVGFGDTRLSSSDIVMNHWWDKVLSNNTRFLLRIESSDDQLPTISGLDNHGEKLLSVKHAALITVVQKEGGMNASTLPHFVYTCGVIFMAFISARILFRLRVRNGLRPSTSPSFDLPKSDGCGEYGSFQHED